MQPEYDRCTADTTVLCTAVRLLPDVPADALNVPDAHAPDGGRISSEAGEQLTPGGAKTPSYKTFWTLGKEIDRFLAEKKESGRSPKTIEDYREVLRLAARLMYDAGLDLNPRRFAQDHVNFLASCWTRREDGSPNTHNYVVHNLLIVRAFVRARGNRQADKLRIAPKSHDRPNARWLEKPQAQLLMREARGVERLVVHCGVRLGLRRIEVIRLTPRDFVGGLSPRIRVRGKGNKAREIPWASDTATELGQWMQFRDSRVAKARASNPDAVVPENLLLYARRGELRPYGESGIDAILERLSRRVGVHFSSHDLRRTYGRLVYFANGRRIGDLVELMGHESEEQTRRYLGLGADHLRETTARTDAYMKAVEIPTDGISGDSQGLSGPNRIWAVDSDWLVVENSDPRNPPRRAIER